jgi:phosphorylcholine metabolism protein LicD
MILIIILVLICIILYYFTDIETFQPLTNIEKENLLKCMNDLHTTLLSHNIWYIIAYGSLLGAVRHHDIIPWDDDMDILVLKSDQSKIDTILEGLQKKGYKIEKTWKLYKVYSDNTHCIDLFFIENRNNKIYRCTTFGDNEPSKDAEWWWKEYEFPSYYLEDRKLFHMNKYNFYSTTHAKELLTYWYGKDCFTTCKTPSYDHETSSYIQEKTISCNSLPPPQF